MDIENVAKSCITCQQNKHAPPPAPLHPWVWPCKPWQRLHIDYAGSILGKSFLMVMDAHSKWPEVLEMVNTSASHTITALRQIFARFGLSEQVVSDNGSQFTSVEFSSFMRNNGIRHIRISPYYPSSNGMAERFVQTLKQSMKASQNDGRTLQQ